LFDFRGRVLWLTGANGGISKAIARTFFDLGATCVLTDLNEDGVKNFAQELDPSGSRCLGIRQDASVSSDADAVADVIGSHLGRLDFLVNSAGLYQDQMVQDMSDDQWRQSVGVNLDGVFYACRAAIPLFTDGSSIVNIASMAGHKGSYMHTHYASSKGAVLTFSRSLALELAPKTRVNAVSPGIIRHAVNKAPTRSPRREVDRFNADEAVRPSRRSGQVGSVPVLRLGLLHHSRNGSRQWWALRRQLTPDFIPRVAIGHHEGSRRVRGCSFVSARG
jgi:3-oxoacyl-[acyl-carrier protein] reductase